MKAKLIYILLFLLIIQPAIGQNNYGIGASGLYKTKSGNFGASARLFIPVHKKLIAVPYGYYNFTNGETSGGISALIPFFKNRSFTLYTIVAGSFKGSANLSLSVNNTSQSTDGSKSYEADGEAGFGVLIGSGCLKGFVEPRYAVLDEEIVLRVGVAYFFKCKKAGKRVKRGKVKKRKKAKKGNGSYNRKKASACPAYN